VIGEAGSSLRAIGRLADAVEPMRVAAEAWVKSEIWKGAAVNYNNLSELHLTLGDVPEATAAARQSVDIADRSGEWEKRLCARTTLANALHQSGDAAEAMRLFTEAERLQTESQPEFPILYSVQGYRYCDLLVEQDQTAEVLRRASQTLLWVEKDQWLLDIGLDHLSLGYAHLSGSAGAAHHLDMAVDFLRRAGYIDMLPLALLARGTPRDLDEVFRIATRSGMRLHLTDYHLASARLALAADYHLARGNLDEAEALINATGYHRRDPDLAKLRAELAG
jgi:tetratricopeptide (TPR) repeat protein